MSRSPVPLEQHVEVADALFRARFNIEIATSTICGLVPDSGLRYAPKTNRKIERARILCEREMEIAYPDIAHDTYYPCDRGERRVGIPGLASLVALMPKTVHGMHEIPSGNRARLDMHIVAGDALWRAGQEVNRAARGFKRRDLYRGVSAKSIDALCDIAFPLQCLRMEIEGYLETTIPSALMFAMWSRGSFEVYTPDEREPALHAAMEAMFRGDA